MPRRIDVELTSERPDGTWTWRAAGARQPRGELEGGLLPSGAKIGDVLTAWAEFDIEGITVTSVVPPKAEEKPAFERLEVIGPQREFTPVTSTLVGRGDRDRGDRGDRSDRGDRGDRGAGRGAPRGPRTDRPDRPPRADRPGGPPRTDRPERRERTPRPEGAPERSARPRRDRPAPPPPIPERPKPKRLRPGRAHRDEFLASLAADRRLIAEQLFKGGVPAVRSALDEQNAKARAEGAPEVPTENVIQVAEDLMPATRIADWLDKADAALTDVEELALNDLRAVVTSAGDVAREERTRELASTLREALDRRTAAEQEQWVGDVKLSMQHGRVVRALRLASRAPEASQVLPDDVLASLATAASAAMTSDIAPDRFATLLDAVAYSPIRRDVEPAGVPAEPGDELLTVVKKHAGRAPAIAKLFGVEPPPPKEKGGRKPRPERAAPRPVAKPQPAGPPVDVGGRKIPPPPRPTGKALSTEGAPSAPASLSESEPESQPASDAVVESDSQAVVDSDSPDVAEPDSPDAVEPEIAVPAPEPAAPTEVGEDVADDAADDSAGEVEVPEEISGMSEDDVPFPGEGSSVPPGEGEGSAGVVSADPVVPGVADEDDV